MKTRKVKVSAGKLEDVNVSWISLVDRPANRVPFRITKRDDAQEEGDGMLNFGKLFGLAKSEEGQPGKAVSVGAVVFAKSVGVEIAKAATVAAGFTIEHMKELPDATVFPQSADYTGENAVIIKMGDLHAITLLNAGPMQAECLKSVAFEGESQYLPGVTLSLEAFSAGVYETLKAESAEAAEVAIQDASKAFADHIGTLVSTIPAAAWKLEKGCGLVEKMYDEEGNPVRPPGMTDEEWEAHMAEAKKGMKKGEVTPETPVTTAVAVVPEPEKVVTEPAKEDNSGKVLETVLAAIEALKTDFRSRLTALDTKIAETGVAAEKAVALATKNEKGIRSVVGGVDAGDPAKVTKADVKPAQKHIPPIDTGMRPLDK